MTTKLGKRVIDLSMIILLIVLMGCSITGDILHEHLGILLFIFFIAHHLFNGSWYRNLVHGGTAQRIAMTILNFLLLVVMGALVISSVLVSRTMFAFIDHDGGIFARQFHQMTAHTALILMATHFGIYLNRFFPIKAYEIEKLTKSQRIIRFVILVFLSCFVVYGIEASFAHDLGEKLLLRQAYSFWNGSPAVFFIDYTAIFTLYTIMAHVLFSRFFRRKMKDYSSENGTE